MAHANAALTPRHRVRLARLVVDEDWPPAKAAEFFNVSWRTADKWARRYREEGPPGMADRSSARHAQPARTPQPMVRKIVHLRWKQRLGPVQLSDNGSPYVSHLWRDTCAELGITHKRTRPRRPQTNGKIERLHRTMADGWAYRRLYHSENARRAALAGWLHQYNHHRPHSALGGQPPISRLDNLARHHN